MNLDEKTIEHLEQQIPDLAEAATVQAYWQALAAGGSVLISKDGKIQEIFPDGSFRTVGQAPPSIKMRKGEKIKLK